MDLQSNSKDPVHVAAGEYEVVAVFNGTASYYELCFVSPRQHAVQYGGIGFISAILVTFLAASMFSLSDVVVMKMVGVSSLVTIVWTATHGFPDTTPALRLCLFGSHFWRVQWNLKEKSLFSLVHVPKPSLRNGVHKVKQQDDPDFTKVLALMALPTSPKAFRLLHGRSWMSTDELQVVFGEKTPSAWQFRGNLTENAEDEL